MNGQITTEWWDSTHRSDYQDVWNGGSLQGMADGKMTFCGTSDADIHRVWPRDQRLSIAGSRSRVPWPIDYGAFASVTPFVEYPFSFGLVRLSNAFAARCRFRRVWRSRSSACSKRSYPTLGLGSFLLSRPMVWTNIEKLGLAEDVFDITAHERRSNGYILHIWIWWRATSS